MMEVEVTPSVHFQGQLPTLEVLYFVWSADLAISLTKSLTIN